MDRNAQTRGELIRNLPFINNGIATNGHDYLAHFLTTHTADLVPSLIEFAIHGEQKKLRKLFNQMIDKAADELTQDRATSGYYESMRFINCTGRSAT